jgi:iron complex outermembrane recepter protein
MSATKTIYAVPSHRRRALRFLLAGASLSAALAGTARAQEAAPPLPAAATTPQTGDTTGTPDAATPASTATAPSGQTADTASGVAGEQDIVVTGYRRSIEKSLNQKREANAFVDVITAEDIGKFPDKNVADALQRVPGVVITRDGGEGARVSIRGLQSDLTLTLLNGNFLAGADSGDPQRSFNYVLLPSSFIASTEVYKSPEARLEEGGVGGTIILNTRKPFDVPAWSGFVSTEGTYSDTTEKFEPQLGGQLSWKNEDETFGLLVGGVWQKRTNRELRSSSESWLWWSDRDAQGNVLTPATDVNGKPFANDDAISYWPGQGTTARDGTHYSGYWAPQSVNAQVFDQERERYGIQATEFSVERLSREVRVALFEGRVAVLRDTPQGQMNEVVRLGGHQLTAERALTPGHEIGLPVSGFVGSVSSSIGNDGWGAEQVSFTSETLVAAAERMNRYAQRRRIIVDPGAADIRVSGVFNNGDVDAFADAIATTFPVDAAVDGEAIRLSRRR